ncbi:MAG: Rieske (2Fe-2S) protein [Candidatus Chlorobium antarcticum]|nr:Rieske (2Fe-2S) protein [Candidatus Chlorobium antarcticum]
MSVTKLKRNFFQRLLGRPATNKPVSADCWSLQDGTVTVDLSKAQELDKAGTAVCLDGKGLESSLLVVHGDDGRFHALKNVCTHGKRQLDPVPGTGTVQCCSIGTSTFSYDGKLIEGPAKGPLSVYRVEEGDGTLKISL